MLLDMACSYFQKVERHASEWYKKLWDNILIFRILRSMEHELSFRHQLQLQALQQVVLQVHGRAADRIRHGASSLKTRLKTSTMPFGLPFLVEGHCY